MVLPYLESQKVMDGDRLFMVSEPIEDSGLDLGRPCSSGVGQWRTRSSRDPSPKAFNIQDYILVGDKKDGVELPFSMRAAERVYGEKLPSRQGRHKRR